MSSIRRIGIRAVGILICLAVFSYVDHAYVIAACLAVLVSLVMLRDMLRMCDRLLDLPPAIFRLFIVGPRIFSGMPPHLLTGFGNRATINPTRWRTPAAGGYDTMMKPRDYQEALGQAIKERRENLEMSREKLGRIAGKDVDYITSVENGDYAKLNLHELLVLSRVLNLRPYVLFAIVEFRLFDD